MINIHSETLKYTHFYDMKMGVFQCLRVYVRTYGRTDRRMDRETCQLKYHFR